MQPLQWSHNGRDSVSNHQPRDCFFSRLFRRWSKKTSKLCVTGLSVGTHNWPVTRKMFPFDDVIMYFAGCPLIPAGRDTSTWWYHYNDVIWASWRLKSHATPLFVQQLIQTDTKENITGPYSLPFGGIHGPSVDYFTESQEPVIGKAFKCFDAIINIFADLILSK